MKKVPLRTNLQHELTCPHCNRDLHISLPVLEWATDVIREKGFDKEGEEMTIQCNLCKQMFIINQVRKY